MPSPRELGLPYDAWRSGQAELIERIQQSSKPFIILQAPTGTGKSLIAMASAAVTPGRSLVLCKTKQLQAQYSECFPDNITVIKGRANFTCTLFPGLNASQAPCYFIRGIDDKRTCLQDCEYKKQLSKAKASKIVSANYPYWFNTWKFVPGNLGNFDFAVCDEAHLLEGEIAKFTSITLNKQTMQANRIKYFESDDLQDWQAWAEMMNPVFASKAEMLEQEVMLLVQANREPESSLLTLVKIYKNLEYNTRQIKHLDSTWIVSNQYKQVQFKPVWVRDNITKIFKGCKKTLLMSATVLDHEIFTEVLGIPQDSYEYIELPCIFPKANRPIYFVPAAFLSHKKLDAELPKLVCALDKILDHHTSQKGIIHAHNYRVARYILHNSKHRNYMLTHSIEDREQILELFKKAAAPAVLISPSMGTGVSLEEDLARYAIIAKMPFPDQGDKVIARRMDSKDVANWYAYATVQELVQSTGRIVRSETDWGVTYILDTNFQWFARKYRSLFPDWWMDSVEIKKLA